MDARVGKVVISEHIEVRFSLNLSQLVDLVLEVHLILEGELAESGSFKAALVFEDVDVSEEAMLGPLEDFVVLVELDVPLDIRNTLELVFGRRVVSHSL